MTTLKDLGIIELEMRIGLDTYHPKVRVTQYDSGLTLEYDIIDRNGEVVTSLPDVVPMLYVESPDKSAIGSAEGEIVDGKAVIPIPSSLLSKFGEAEAQVQLVNSKTKEQIHDNTFVLDIAQSKMDGEVTAGESIWFNLQDLKEAIASVQQLEEQYNADVQAVETMREDVTTKHGEVTTMHSSLQDVFDSESARVLAEKARADAEKLRASAETTRANNETKRVTAETGRVTAETGRVDAETAREAAEAERKAQYAKSTDLFTKGSALYSKSDPLYTEMKALQDVMGKEPNVEMAKALAEIQSGLGARNLAQGTTDKWQTDVYTDAMHFREWKIGITPKVNKIYTFQIELLGDINPVNVHVGLGNEDRYTKDIVTFRKSNIKPDGSKIIIKSSVSKEEFDSVPDDQRILWFRIRNERIAGRISHRCVMLEEGHIAHTWRPSIEDMQKSAPIGTILNPQEMSENADLNEIKKAGFYVCSLNTKAETFKNSPTSFAFSLEVQQQASSRGSVQILREYGQGGSSYLPKTFIREMYDTTIKEWREIISKQTSDKIYAPLSHTHNYAPTNHTHDYAPSSHTHNYAPTSHTHTIANVTGLKDALDSKQSKIAIGTTAPTSTTGYSEGDIFLVVP